MTNLSLRATTGTVNVLNLGAGVQSTALAIAFEEGVVLDPAGAPIRLTAAIFADTGDEPKAVYRHLDWLLRTIKGYPILVRSKGRLSDDLRQGVNSTGGRFASIPAFVRKPNGQVSKTRRQCSKEYKVEVLEKTIRRDLCGLAPGRTVGKGVRVVQYLGISADEQIRAIRVLRAKVPKAFREAAAKWTYEELTTFFGSRKMDYAFPLVDGGLHRGDCLGYLALRVPHTVPRSACVHCPFHTDEEWYGVKHSPDPEDWALALVVDRDLRLGGTEWPMYLHRSCQPLELVQFGAKPDERKVELNPTFREECLGVCGV